MDFQCCSIRAGHGLESVVLHTKIKLKSLKAAINILSGLWTVTQDIITIIHNYKCGGPVNELETTSSNINENKRSSELQLKSTLLIIFNQFNSFIFPLSIVHIYNDGTF